MDDTTRAIIQRITTEHKNPIAVPGGHQCKVFYETTKLTTSELARLAALAVGDKTGERLAVGVANTGVFFAYAVASGGTVGLLDQEGNFYGAPIKGHKVVVVDDVVCTGKRLIDAASKIQSLGGIVEGFAVIIDRREKAGELNGLPVWSAFQTDLR